MGFWDYTWFEHIYNDLVHNLLRYRGNMQNPENIFVNTQGIPTCVYNTTLYNILPSTSLLQLYTNTSTSNNKYSV